MKAIHEFMGGQDLFSDSLNVYMYIRCIPGRLDHLTRTEDHVYLSHVHLLENPERSVVPVSG
jgi:hypothetical protein